MLEFVDSDLYFVQVKNNFINPLLQVGSGSGSIKKSTGSGSGGPNINGSDRIRILIPDKIAILLYKVGFNRKPSGVLLLPGLATRYPAGQTHPWTPQ